MDPGVKELLERLSGTMEDMRRELCNNTAAVRTQASRMEEFAAWRPEMEARVGKLCEAVASLERGRLGEDTVTNPQPLPHYNATGDLVVAGGSGLADPHGSTDHGDPAATRGWAPVGFVTPGALPANGQFPLPSPGVLSSPFAQASQMLAGLGQAHPAIGFPQFDGENPNLWKTCVSSISRCLPSIQVSGFPWRP